MNSENGLSSECEAALVISCGAATPEQVILNIIGVESPPDGVTEQIQNLKTYPWSFETKYYSAEVNLLALKEKDTLDAGLCSTIRAVVFYFDLQKESSFDEVLSWMPSIKDIEAEVQLMVCNNSADESDNLAGIRKKFLNWCVKNQYELIELNPSSDSDDEEGAVKSAKGYERVVEALQSYTWANLVMKNMTDQSDDANDISTEDRTAESQEANAEATNAENATATNAEHCKEVSVDGEELMLVQEFVNGILSGDELEDKELDFDALLGKFASMKAKANTLNGEERKKYAEKVAIAFWEAVGGDKEEIEGLDDLED